MLEGWVAASKPEEERIRAKYARRISADPRYSWFNPGQVFMLQERERRFLEIVKRAGIQSLSELRILEIGCGQGAWLRDFIKYGAQPQNLTGVELLPERAEQAKSLSASGVRIVCGSAASLDFPDGSFDLVLQSTVFTSIQDSALKQQVAREMVRLVRPDGLIVWYDFRVNNPANADVTGIGKREVQDLFTGCIIDLFPITLAPPLVRRLARWTWLSCYVLGKVPWLCTHYLGAIRKRRP